MKTFNNFFKYLTVSILLVYNDDLKFLATLLLEL